MVWPFFNKNPAARYGGQNMVKVIAIVCQKGGVGKTTTSVNLGIELARRGKRVLLIDADSQGSMTASLGFTDSKIFTETLASIMSKIMADTPIDTSKGILKHTEGVYLLPATSDLAATEMNLVNAISRESIMREYIYQISMEFDYIIIDTQPSLGLLTVNVLAAADSVIIPVQAEFLAAKGLEQLLNTVFRIQKRINKALKIGGILLTMLNGRTNESREIIRSIKNAYGSEIRIFTSIPRSVRVPESSKLGCSIYQNAPNSKVAIAYQTFAREVLSREK
jgi:chromosome partitioning protein